MEKSKKRLFKEAIKKYEEFEMEMGLQAVKVTLKKKKLKITIIRSCLEDLELNPKFSE